jgi:ferredoxin-NADP reductase
MGPWLDRIEGLRRDARRVIDDLRGQPAPPFRERHAGQRHLVAAPSGTAMLAPRLVEIASKVQETPDAVSLVVRDVGGAPLHAAPGQFFTLLLSVGGETLRRAYSASSLPADHDGAVRLTIKRVAGGKASTALVEGAREGDRLQLLGPSGSFGPVALGERRRRALLVAGGSGITPMLPIARAILDAEPASDVVLVYGNRSAADVIFAREIEALAAREASRFTVISVLEASSLGVDGETGRLDRAMLDRVLPTALANAGERALEAYVCGPEPMMVAARAALLDAGLDAAAVHEERFSQPHLRRDAEREPFASQPVRIRRADGQTIELRNPPGETLLEAGLAAGAPLPFSCTMGGCGACKVKLVSGEVEADEPNCLGPSERAEGLVLACVSRPRSPVVLEVLR